MFSYFKKIPYYLNFYFYNNYFLSDFDFNVKWDEGDTIEQKYCGWWSYEPCKSVKFCSNEQCLLNHKVAGANMFFEV